jgi:uncharacterized protein
VATARHNPTDGLYAQANGLVICTIGYIVAGQLTGPVLIVDDICGTGATLTTVTSTVASLAGPGASLHTMTLCRNAGAAIRPDLTIWDDLREWVIFPWEPRPPANIDIRPLPAPARARAR